MTDVPWSVNAVPGRLGVAARVHAGELELDLVTQPGVLHHAILRASVVSYLVDAVAGIVLDHDPDRWLLTSDMTVRSSASPAPAELTATNTVLRDGRRSAIGRVEVTSAGSPYAVGTVGFVRVPRRPTDPPKPLVVLESAVRIFDPTLRLSLPLRDEAGIEVLDAPNGVVRLRVTPSVRNPAGTLQGAMVALVAEAAAEEMIAARLGVPVVVIDLDIRYLATAPEGPVLTSCRWVGPPELGAVEVQITDSSTTRLTTLVYARAVPVNQEEAT